MLDELKGREEQKQSAEQGPVSTPRGYPTSWTPPQGWGLIGRSQEELSS